MQDYALVVEPGYADHSINEAALAGALTSGRLAGAGPDVLAKEPPERGHVLLGLNRIVLSDHAGWYSEATVSTLQQRAGEEAVRIPRGEAPLNWVNPW